MVSFKDTVFFLSILIGSVVVLGSVAGASLPGTGSSNYVCSVPVVSDFVSNCGTEVEEKYDVSTSIRVEATDVNAVLNEGSFEYETSPASPWSLSLIGFDRDLAFGGANDVELGFQLENSDGVTVADGSQYIGELGIIQSETVEFGVDNRPTGDYTVKYELSYKPDFGVDEGVEQVKTLEKEIRVPRRIE